jgi:hypothetical protein
VFRPVLGGYLIFMYLMGLGIRGFIFLGKNRPGPSICSFIFFKDRLGLGAKNIVMARYDRGWGFGNLICPGI